MRNRPMRAALLSGLAAIAYSSLAWAQASATSAQPERAGTTGGTLSPAQGSPQRQAAEAGLRTLAGRLPASSQTARPNRIFSVDDYRLLEDATIGEGFETYLADPQALLSGKDLDQSAYGSGEWRFVVMLRGRPVGLITVARMNGKWTMVEAGASGLADEVVSVATRYAQQAPSAQLRFIRSRQAVADFIEVATPSEPAGANTHVYVPLASARAMLAQHLPAASASTAALSDAQLGDTLRQSVRRGMRDPRFAH